ncbi:MAG: superoxide dismutase [Bacteroidia bacterium]|nr:superoxide dismutase [Bacteroidia bacterium]
MDTFPYKLPKLPYGYDAMEPFIEKQTMEIHHTKHHQTYINNLNKALENLDFKNAPLIELFRKVSVLDKSIRNNGGGHYNHTLFWQMLKPNPNKQNNVPSAGFQKILAQHFKSFDEFKKQFSDAAAKHFGSGWCWLVAKNKNELKIVTTPNQDNPIMDVVDAKDRGFPLLGIDVWEHAYYLKYQNRRVEYIENWWNIVHWEFVEKRWNNLK